MFTAPFGKGTFSCPIPSSAKRCRALATSSGLWIPSTTCVSCFLAAPNPCQELGRTVGAFRFCESLDGVLKRLQCGEHTPTFQLDVTGKFEG